MNINNLNQRATVALSHWRRAVEKQEIILKVRPRLEFLADYSWIHMTTVMALAYLISFPLEFFFLGTTASPFFQELLGNDLSSTDLILITTGVVVALSFLLHVLISQSSFFLFPGQWRTFRLKEFKVEKPNEKEGSAAFYIDEELRLKKRLALFIFIPTIILVTALALYRAYILGGHIPLSEENWLDYLLSLVIAMVFLICFIWLEPAFSIWNKYLVTKRKIRQARRKRDKALKQFRNATNALFEMVADPQDFFHDYEDSSQIKQCLEYYEVLQKDDGSYDCLVPVQSLRVRVTWEGQSASQVQVKALTPQGIGLARLTDQDGIATLEWKAFHSRLDLLAVGNKYLHHFKPPETKETEVELSEKRSLFVVKNDGRLLKK